MTFRVNRKRGQYIVRTGKRPVVVLRTLAEVMDALEHYYPGEHNPHHEQSSISTCPFCAQDRMRAS